MNNKISDLGLIILILLLLSPIVVFSQDINVSSFRILENDLTANTHATMVKDRNGEVAALIKVVTVEKGFVFDGGMTGIVSSKQEAGEVWVYVPHGIKKITIRHPQLGVLRDYYFDIPIEKARTYEMKLTTGKIETVVTHAVRKQFVMFNVSPTNAVVELGGEILTVDTEGNATKSVPYGEYDYQVSCANYHPEAGKVTVDAQGRAEVNVTLRPNFGWINFTGAEELHGAYIYIDNERVGQLPLISKELRSGTHQVKAVKSLYKNFDSQVTITDNDTLALEVTMAPNFANVTLSTDTDSEIWIDSEKKGKGQWTGPLEMGDYTIEAKKEGHRTTTEVLHIGSSEARTVQLESPTPIYASLEISSTPLHSIVYIDNVEAGETPLIKDELTVGSHRVTFKKEGYKTIERTIVIEESAENSISAELQEGEDEKSLPKTKEKETNQKGSKKWRMTCGIDAGYTTSYGNNYGAELGIILNRISLTTGIKNHLVGGYATCDYPTGNNPQNHAVELLRFTTKIGYSLPIGKYFQITPQIGLVYGPSCYKGYEYLSGGVLSWYEISDNTYIGRVLSPNVNHSVINNRITSFAKNQCCGVGSLRMELKTANSLVGLHITPEYVLGEGGAINGGLVIRF